jgi:hypothetical protein
LTAVFAFGQSVPQGLEWEINEDGKSVTITRYSGNAATLQIPEMIQGLPVMAIASYAFDDEDVCENLTSINIPFLIMNISGSAFSGYGNLTNITVDSRNYWYTGIDGILFDKDKKTIICYPQGKKAGTYSIPSSITAIGDGAFSGCENLTSINIPSSVTAIGDWAFAGCGNLTNITVDNRNSSYSNIDGILFDKNKTTIVKYPEGKKASAYSIPSSVTDIGEGAFAGCENLTNINIPSSVTTIGKDAFAGCENLTSINIPSSVTDIGEGAFSFCMNLKSISIPSSVTEIGEGAFSGCENLTNINIPSSLTFICDWAFSGCKNLTSITVDSRNPKYASIDGVLFDKDKTYIIQYPGGKKEDTYSIPSSVTSIGWFAFSGCENLTSINIPSSVTSIGDSAFSDCINLTSINIPSSVTEIGYHAFAGCINLTSINIPSSVTEIGEGTFDNCENLTSVTLSRRTRVGENAFPASARITYRN